MTLVSIITPSYNQAEYLDSTLQSVLSQDYPAIEYFVIDGGSRDGSLDIIQKHSSRLAGWVSEADAGQAAAINKGFSKASGEIVAWLNSDDLYLPGAVSEAVYALQEQPQLGMVYGDALTIDAVGQPLSALKFSNYRLLDLMGFRIICQPAVFMRRSALEKSGYLDDTYQFLLDHHLWLRIARLSPIQHVPSMWAAARQHPGAKNVAQAAGFGAEVFRILDWMRLQPDLAPIVRKHRRRIEAGAHRLNGRYLLDGGYPGPALQAYARALWLSPGFALQHWHRMVYAALSLVGGKGLASWYYRLRRSRRPPISETDLYPMSRE